MAEGLPAAVVTGIRGCKRLAQCTLRGAIGHSAALPPRSEALTRWRRPLRSSDHMEGRVAARGGQDRARDLLLTTGETVYRRGGARSEQRSPGRLVSCSICAACRRRSWRRSPPKRGALRSKSRSQYRVSFDSGRSHRFHPRDDGSAPGELPDEPARAGRWKCQPGAGHDAAVFAKGDHLRP